MMLCRICGRYSAVLLPAVRHITPMRTIKASPGPRLPTASMIRLVLHLQNATKERHRCAVRLCDKRRLELARSWDQQCIFGGETPASLARAPARNQAIRLPHAQACPNRAPVGTASPSAPTGDLNLARSSRLVRAIYSSIKDCWIGEANATLTQLCSMCAHDIVLPKTPEAVLFWQTKSHLGGRVPAKRTRPNLSRCASLGQTRDF